MPPSESAAERRSPPRAVRAFAPGRVNLIGEHTDYNGGLALPFAVAEGVTVHARSCLTSTLGGERSPCIRAHALDLHEDDEFTVTDAPHGEGWRAYVRGTAAELRGVGVELPSAELWIQGTIPRGAGLSSSAALEVSLALALVALAGGELDRCELAHLCSRVEHRWVGARTGLLDQLASLFGVSDAALRIDFSDSTIETIPFALAEGWLLATIDSGERRELALSRYNERRVECARACELLGVSSLRASTPGLAASLPEPLARRARHVLGENARVLQAAVALRSGDLMQLGALLDASHASLRELYECSTPAVERSVAHMKRAGAVGARMIGGGFGGSVLGLFPPAARPPRGAHEVRPSRGAHLFD